MKKYYLLLLLVLPVLSCRKSFKKPAETVLVPVTVQFDASAYDVNAVLNVEIFDTNTQGVYYKGTTTTNTYSGQTEIMQGSTVTFRVSTTSNTNLSTQISSNNKVVASGTYNAAQGQGSAPVSVIYYKVQ